MARGGRGAPSLAAPSSSCTDDFGTRFLPVGVKERDFKLGPSVFARCEVKRSV